MEQESPCIYTEVKFTLINTFLHSFLHSSTKHGLTSHLGPRVLSQKHQHFSSTTYCILQGILNATLGCWSTPHTWTGGCAPQLCFGESRISKRLEIERLREEERERARERELPSKLLLPYSEWNGNVVAHFNALNFEMFHSIGTECYRTSLCNGTSLTPLWLLI